MQQQYLSTLHVFGLNIAEEIRTQHLQSMHARLLNLADPSALFVPELDTLFTKLNCEPFQQNQLPIMQGGIDYVAQKETLHTTNAKFYKELVSLTKVKTELAQ